MKIWVRHTLFILWFKWSSSYVLFCSSYNLVYVFRNSIRYNIYRVINLMQIIQKIGLSNINTDPFVSFYLISLNIYLFNTLVFLIQFMFCLGILFKFEGKQWRIWITLIAYTCKNFFPRFLKIVLPKIIFLKMLQIFIL